MCSHTLAQIRRAYFYEFENNVRNLGKGDQLPDWPVPPGWRPPTKRQLSDDVETGVGNNETLTPPVTLRPAKRNPDSEPNTKWHLGQISTPPGVVFQKNGPHTYSYDDSLGRGQTIFILDDGFVDIPAVRNLVILWVFDY